MSLSGNQLSPKHRLLFALALSILPPFLRFVRWSWRKAVRHEKHVATQAMQAEGSPAIYVLWHGRMFAILQAFATGDITILVSPSRDGEFIVQAAQRIGMRRFIRGAHNRGGSKAVRHILKALTEENERLLVLADGPRGPREVLKPGVVKLAAMAGVPIVPLAAAAQLYLKHYRRSWDCFRAPFFFSPQTIVWGQPLKIDAAAAYDDTILERERLRVESALNAVSHQADCQYPQAKCLMR